MQWGAAMFAAAAGAGGAPAPLTLPTTDLLAAFPSDLAAITDVSGDASNWADQSGNGYSVRQTNASERPAIIDPYAALNNKPALLFDWGGGYDYLIANNTVGDVPPATTNGSFTVHAVVDVRALTSTLATVYGANSGTQQFLCIRNVGGRKWMFYDGTAYRDTGALAVTGPQVITLVCDASSSVCRIYRNGVQLGSDMTYVSNPIGGVFTIAATVNTQNEWDGHIAELDIYDGAQDASALADVWAYMTQEFAVP